MATYSEYSNIVNARTFTSELITYMTGLVTPLSYSQVILLNNFIYSILSGWSVPTLATKVDAIYIWGGETEESSLKNIVKDLHHCTLAGATEPTFVQYEGFTGDGSTGYINTNHVPAGGSKNSVTYTLGSASVGIYVRTDVDENKSDIANVSGNNRIVSRYSNKIYWDLNQNLVTTTPANTDSRGMHIMTGNDGDNTAYYYKNKIAVDSKVGNQNVVGEQAFYIGRIGTSYSTRQYSGAILGGYLTQTEVGVFTDAFEAYMDSNGRGVIT